MNKGRNRELRLVVSDRLYRLRERAELSQAKAADMAEAKQSSWAKWEMGDYLPGAENLVAIADSFGCSVDYILGRTDDPG